MFVPPQRHEAGEQSTFPPLRLPWGQCPGTMADMTNPRNPNRVSVVVEIKRFGKVARRRDLLAAGCTPKAIEQALALGQVRKVARGHYALPWAEPQDVILARHQARPACFTMARQMKLWVIKDPPVPHVATASGRPIPGFVVHRISGVPTLMDILRQCVACGTEVEALTVFESAVVNHHCTIPELRIEFSRRTDARARAIIELLDPQSMSILETVARYYLRKEGYNVQGQYFQKDVGRLDLLVEGLLGIETDGRQYHDNYTGWENDLYRDNFLTINGLWHLRIPSHVVLHRPDIMIDWVRLALARITAKPP